MLYTRWGNEVKIVARGAPIEVKGVPRESFDVHPVKIEYYSESVPGVITGDRWILLEYLRADNGAPELEAAAATAPLVDMTKANIRQAQE